MNSHQLMVGVTNSDDSSTAIANATQWLVDEIGEIQVFHEVGAKTWKGDINVHFFVRLSDDQLQAVKESDTITHLGEMDS